MSLLRGRFGDLETLKFHGQWICIHSDCASAQQSCLDENRAASGKWIEHGIALPSQPTNQFSRRDRMEASREGMEPMDVR